MDVGMIGLGRMGGNMAQRLVRQGHRVVAWTRDPEKTVAGCERATSIADMVGQLAPPRTLWTMVPAGEVTEALLQQLLGLVRSGDTVVDGGNAYYRDSVRRAQIFADRGVDFVDVGVSGGIWGLKVGYCLMAGGPEAACARLEPIFRSLAPEGGYLRVGPAGAGHFVKMVHNGIEYALLQAYGEGFELLRSGPYADLDLAGVAGLWLHGSVVRSWLLELARDAFATDPGLLGVRGYIDDSGEGRWTVAEAIERNLPAPVITLSLLERLRSRQNESFAAKVIAALRHEFGGHPLPTGEGA